MSTKIKLKSMRNAVTRNINELESMVGEKAIIDDMHVSISNLNDKISRLEAINVEHETYLKGMNDLQDEEYERELDKMEQYRESAQTALTRATLAIEKIKLSNDVSVVGQTHNNRESLHKLPKLKLPIFSGEILEWFSFEECFRATIDSTSLSDVEKFSYLRANLRAEPLALISGLTLTANNYSIALELLTKRYGNKHRRIRAHTRELLNVQTPSIRDATSLRRFVDNVNLHMRGLDALQVPSVEFDVILCEILLSRVPFEIKQEFAKLPEENMVVKELLTVLENHAKLLDMTPSLISAPTPSHKRATSQVVISNISKRSCNLCHTTKHLTFQCDKLVNQLPQARLEIIKQNRLCYNCFGTHQANKCPSQSRCKTCGRSHNTMLHIERAGNHATDLNPEEQSKQNASAHVAQSSSAVLPVVSMTFTKSSGTTTLTALLDTGSDRSFIRTSKLLDISHRIVNQKSLTISSFGEHSTSERFDIIAANTVIHDIEVPIQLISVPNLCNTRRINRSEVNKCLNNLKLPVAFSHDSDEVDVIIGVDLFAMIVTGKFRRIHQTARAIETVYGWTIFGNLEATPNDQFSCTLATSEDCPHEDRNIRKFWDIELAGILPKVEHHDQSTLVMTRFNDSIQFSNGRYIVRLPFIECTALASSYFKEAQRRLYSNVRSLLEKKNLQNYDAIFKEYLELGIIEQVEPHKEEDACRFLPHHAVIKEEKSTTKIRPVFDASAKTSPTDFSLNDLLHEGPKLQPDILGIFLRFRMFQYGVIADAEKAFLQIVVHEDDRDFLRLLWFRNTLDNQHHPVGKPSEYRFTRVPFGTKSSPFLLNATLKHHISKYSDKCPHTVAALSNDLYVDDLTVSEPKATDIVTMAAQATTIFAEMSMNLRKFTSNIEVDGINDLSNEPTKVLGILWDPKCDTLSLNIEQRDGIATKRQLSSLICGFFDPIGLMAPYVLRLKIILRAVWEDESTGWDDHLPENIIANINAILKDLPYIFQHKVPRWFGVEATTQIQLHGYGDASPKAYAATVYIRFSTTSGDLSSQLVAAKSRISPKKTLSLPRLELMACLITARLLKYVKTEILALLTRGYTNFEEIPCYGYSDSQVCLQWIQNITKTQERFVQNRVVEIRNLLDPHHWSYVSSAQNPADFATKEHATKKWLNNSLWWTGLEETSGQIHDTQPGATVLEASSTSAEQTDMINISDTNFDSGNDFLGGRSVVDLKRFSNYRRLLRTMCYVFRFCKILRRLTRVTGTEYFTKHDYNTVEMFLIKQDQKSTFSEYASLVSNKPIGRESKLASLEPFLDENMVIRVTGRLHNASLPFETRHPVILSSKSYFCQLLVKNLHIQLLHANTNLLTTELRRQFWILGARRLVKSVVHQCLTCRKQTVKNAEERFAPLPPDRVTESDFRPFEDTGLDYFGPLRLPKSEQKYYVLLMTCLKIRAIHLELVDSQDTKSFILAFSRFISRRGIPSRIRSDNGKTFKCAAGLLADKYRIEWRFNVDLAPWTGGVWERLNRSVKTPLRLALKGSISSPDQLYTVLCQIEFLVNRRPISYSLSSDDGIVPLCPTDFLIPSCKSHGPPNGEPVTTATLLSNLNSQRKIIFTFWKRWKAEYLCALAPNRSVRRDHAFHVGDVVLVAEGAKRQFWPLARILELRPGRDGKIRSVKIRMRNKEFLRPIKLIHNLEI